jgi:hypothetical protein
MDTVGLSRKALSEVHGLTTKEENRGMKRVREANYGT